MGQFKKYFDPEWPMPLISISSHDQYCAPPTKPEGGAFAIYRINQCFCIANVSGSGHQAPAACHGFSPELSRAGVFFGND
jgi:hypothetical protein